MRLFGATPNDVVAVEKMLRDCTDQFAIVTVDTRADYAQREADVETVLDAAEQVARTLLTTDDGGKLRAAIARLRGDK